VEAVAEEIGGRWLQVDVADRRSVEHAFAEAGEVDLLVANAGVMGTRGSGALGEDAPGRRQS
jgi:NADP-dependent 3-hydroxy acid dehydrogenase YdfG